MTRDDEEAGLVGRVVDGRFRVLRMLGSGGMGAVYLAEQLNLSRQVALKVLRPGVLDEAFRTRFKAEAMATSCLNHPNIVTVHDFGIDTSGAVPLPYLVLEKLAGQTLRERLQTRGRLSVDDGVAVLIGIATALAEAHAAGIIHRDLKPENVFLVERATDASIGTVKVLDFGIAKILDTEGAHTQTASGVVVGTPGYVAPERMANGVDDPRGDLYALGIIAWEVFAGRVPFEAPTPMALSLKHMIDPAPLLSSRVDVPPALDALVTSLLDKLPAGRPADAKATVRALRAVTGTSSSPTPLPPPTPLPMVTAPTPTTSTPPAAARSRAPLALGLAVVVVAVAVAVGWSMRSRVSAREEGLLADAADNLGAAITAWTRGCETENDPASCRLLAAALMKQSKATEITERHFDALELYRRGCKGGDIPACVELGRSRAWGLNGSVVDAPEAMRALMFACHDKKDARGCFYYEVVTGAGLGNARIELGAITLGPGQREAVELDCNSGDTVACFALSLVDIHAARGRDDFAKVLEVRTAWRRFCDAGVSEACDRLHDDPRTAAAVAEGVVKYALKDYAGALASYETALLGDPDNVDALYNAAAMHAQLHHDDDALRLLKRVFALDPTRAKLAASDEDFAAQRKTDFFAKLLE
jgi:tRNA A-37 threonylcarbamoyl transferase component Bud32/tetratricopeptide (TPR) repeat protein